MSCDIVPPNSLYIASYLTSCLLEVSISEVIRNTQREKKRKKQ